MAKLLNCCIVKMLHGFDLYVDKLEEFNNKNFLLIYLLTT